MIFCASLLCTTATRRINLIAVVGALCLCRYVLPLCSQPVEKLRPGSPCNEYLGYCDVFQRCRPVDAEGPLARLKNTLLNQRTLMSIKQWAITHWWACALFAIGFMMLMYVFIECCAVHTPTSNPKKKPALRIVDTIRHPSHTLRRKRRSHEPHRGIPHRSTRPNENSLFPA